MLLCKQKKSNCIDQGSKGKRFLINITVLGSAGPIRFIVNEDELVASVIDTALKSYAREGRLPILRSDVNTFMLYCPISGTEALGPWETIGSVGVRNFTLCKKPRTEDAVTDKEKTYAISTKGAANIWKSWFHKARTVKVTSH